MVIEAAHDQHGDHVESLDSIAQAGAALETPVPGAPGQALALANDQDDALEIAVALELLRAAAIPFAPDHTQGTLLQIWTDKQLFKVAEAIVALCRFHGWTVGEFFTEFGPYMQLLAALGLPVLGTIKVLKMPPPKPNGQQQQA